jgi:ABC-2 type transport system ATP-binding protein
LLTEVEHVCDRIAIVRSGRVVAQGTIAEILGEQHGVRIRARSNGTPIEPRLAAFGAVTREGDAFIVKGVVADRVPKLVSALVSANAEIFAIEPLGTTLEQRFLELTRETHE